jgi:methionyl-tRNA synthetase
MPKTKKPKRILVTAALPYANGSIHIGHLVEYIQTDIFVRFLKLIGEDAIFCCADDTHGTPISIKAQQEGVLPEELVERFYKEHTEDFARFLIHFDSYYSTNSAENKQFSETIFKKLKEKGLIYRKDVELAYCEKCKRFLPDRYIKGKCPKCGAPDQYGDVCEHCKAAYATIDLVEPYCTICNSTPERRVSNHYFFKLSACAQKLEKWLTENKKLQSEIRNYILNFIKEGVDDWDISRDGPYFGFKIPGEDNMYFYVWLDAPIGYISSTANYCKKYGRDALKDYWKSKDAQIIHVIGKDIIYFHYLFWPAVLMESELNLPDYIVTHGFLTVNGEKMSKSRGTFFTARDFADKFEPEHLRYYYARLMSKKMMDIDLNLDEFKDKVNNELVANIANFCFRVLSFAQKNFESKIAKSESAAALEKEILAKVEDAKKAYADFNLKQALKDILAVSASGNKYFQENEPWKLIAKDKEKAHRIVGTCVNIVKILSIILFPVLPRFCDELQKQLNLKKLSWNDIDFDLADCALGEPKMLVRKIEAIPTKKIFPANLKVAKILEASPHPEADKLVVLKIDLGTEKRQIIAGIKALYRPEDLVGRNIIVVTNLKPAKLRGLESRGMLLVGMKDKSNFVLLDAPESAPGDQVLVDDYDINTQQIGIEDFAAIKLSVKDKKVWVDEHILHTSKEEILADTEDGAKVQ